MNKLFSAALLAGASFAIQLADHSLVAHEDLLDLAMKEDKEDAEYAEDGHDHIVGPDFNDKPHGKHQLAQTGQYVYTCGETFRRFDDAVKTDVGSVLAAGAAWSDPQYPMLNAMYGITSSYSWKRMSVQFPESSGYTLFQSNLMSSINIDDTIQGYLGDCWVLSSIAAGAEKPERIWRMFDTKTYNPAGIYSIRFYELGVPISVVIDDYLPISGTQNLFVKANTPQKETWPLLIEKAFSKIHGNYKAIEGGWMVDAGNTFYGTGGSSLTPSSQTAAALWTTAKQWDDAGYIMTAATSASLDGIIGGHAYTFIGCYTLSNGVQLFKLRNPWGSSEWTGAYADTDVFWTNNPADATAVGWLNKNDGDFFMTVPDFQSHFTSLAYNYDSTTW